MMSTLSDVSLINTRVGCPITRGWSLVPHQFRGLVSHISPLKQYSKTCFDSPTQPVHRYQCNRNGIVESPVGCFIGPRPDFGLGIISTCDIADGRFSMPLRHVTGWTLRCFVLCWFLLLVTLGKLGIIYIPYHSIKSCTFPSCNKNNFPTH